MGDLQLENFPDELRERLLRQAYKREMSLDDVILAALERQMARMEFNEELAEKGMLSLTVTPAELHAVESLRHNADR